MYASSNMPPAELFLQTFVKRKMITCLFMQVLDQLNETPAVTENSGVNLFSVVAGK